MQSLTEIAEDPSGKEIIYLVKLASFIALIHLRHRMPDFFAYNGKLPTPKLFRDVLCVYMHFLAIVKVGIL